MQNTDFQNWVKISDAAKVVGKSERTLRRWATGKTKDVKIETRVVDGQMMVNLDELSRYTAVSPNVDTVSQDIIQNTPVTTKSEIKYAAEALQEKEKEVIRLQALIQGKDELVEELRRSNDRYEQSMLRLETVIMQMQTAFTSTRTDQGMDKVSASQATKALVNEIAPGLVNESPVNPTPLHYAAHKGNLEKVIALLKEGDSPNDTNGPGYTPLHYATLRGHSQIVEQLIASGAIPDAQDRNGWSSLHGAALRNQLDIAKILLSRGADPDLADNLGNTALHVAAMNSNDRLAELLLISMADPNARNTEDKTPLTLAIEKAAMYTAQIIKSHGGTE
jgi:hypothetical protein